MGVWPRGSGLLAARPWRLGPDRCTVGSVTSPRPPQSWHAGQDVADGMPVSLVDGRPSAYSQAQGTREVKGLTLHPEGTLEHLRGIQRHNCERAARDKAMQAQVRARRLRWQTAVTVLLWVAAVVVVLVYS